MDASSGLACIQTLYDDVEEDVKEYQQTAAAQASPSELCPPREVQHFWWKARCRPASRPNCDSRWPAGKESLTPLARRRRHRLLTRVRARAPSPQRLGLPQRLTRAEDASFCSEWERLGGWVMCLPEELIYHLFSVRYVSLQVVHLSVAPRRSVLLCRWHCARLL